ncbi:flagellar hook-basal body complex protein FliE [Niameybacter massiliensis]|uniref:Flagellar hook-basal body complex protein FliE n=1 Tax=Holtiella tumoricola TaxID=3018743 RepID=A0AA42DPX6_9FIRM|nr:flagellar hook-basal body complex protein FliE [Niameybacter massiliensis]MDA3732583.1 flagellar hook-basal body complex protein FliE [Holtiella tumoricola]
MVEQKLERKTDDGIFQGALESAQQLLEATVKAENETSELSYDFMTGKTDNIHNLMIAQEKSSILLQFTMQVRNQVMQAYQEIMRISV